LEQLSLLELFVAPPPAARTQRRPKIPSERPTAALERLAAAYLRPLRKLRWLCPRKVKVVFNGRLRSTLGRADFSAVTVELNPHLLDRNPRELVPTLVHELCHLAAGPRAGHGPKWKSMMAACGAEPTVCHRLDTSHIARRRRIWLWRCRTCGEGYPRHHRGARRYRCADCGGRFQVLAVPETSGGG
jgi:predicted SprT family Zn-dependent metalloprotease